MTHDERDDLTVAATAATAAEAAILHARLAAAGVRAVITDELGGTALGLGGTGSDGVNVQVRAADLERARAVLEGPVED